jgi:peptide/nickel transport system substrate-binding protein
VKKKKNRFVLIVILILAACARFQPQADAPTAAFTPLPTRTPEPAPPSSLTICLGQEPNSLYPFGELNDAARAVLAAINDGPFDIIAYEYQPVILTRMPSLENGEAQIVRTEVQAGGPVVDADGEVVALAAGVRVRPSECRSDDCVIAYDGTSPLEMDQMLVNFHLRPDLTWSDGAPLTADDSVYAFQIAVDAGFDEYLIERTQAYEAADPQTLQWWGMPGFIDPSYFTNFWAPAPKHIWSDFSTDQLPSADVAAHKPPGWGAYTVDEWLPGDHIALVRNPYYFLARDGYPKIDRIIFRFTADPNLALSEFVAGRCDVLDPSIPLDTQAGLFLTLQDSEQAQVFFESGLSIEWLGFGLVPASYDDGYDDRTDRQNIFADPHTRQGIAHCLDRQRVVDSVFFGMASVPAAFVPLEHPLFDPNIQTISYDPEAGKSLLELAGWQDTDDDPSTPRRAVNVRGVAFNTPLQLNYYTTNAAQRRQVAEILERSLAECGVALEVGYFSPNDLYAPGPDGPLFGRRFDLAEYALGVDGIEPPCNWFTSAEIPSAANSWKGTNVSGYDSAEFDAACRAAQNALPDEQDHARLHRQAQILFSGDLPAIPLYYRLRIAAARPDLCRFDLEPSAGALWNIEAFDLSPTCQK